MKTFMSKLTPLCALALVAVPVAAQAKDPLGTTSVEVKYHDLDLTRAAHQERLDQRIAGAVTKVCGRASPYTLPLNNEINECRAQAMQSAKSSARVAIAEAQQRRAFASNAEPVVGN